MITVRHLGVVRGTVAALPVVAAKEPHHKLHDVVKVTRHTEYSHGHPIPPHDLVTVTKHTEYSYGHPPPPHVVQVARPMMYSHSHPPPHDVVRVTRHTEYSYGHPHPPTVRVSEHVEYPHSHAIETGEPTELSGFNCLLPFWVGRGFWGQSISNLIQLVPTFIAVDVESI